MLPGLLKVLLNGSGTAAPFTPAALSPTLWLTAGPTWCLDGASPGGNGSEISTWTDRSGNGYDMTNSSGFPVLALAATKWSMNFDGGGAKMVRTATFPQLPATGEYTIMEYGNEANGVHMVFSRYDPSTPVFRRYNQSNAAQTNHFNVASITAANTYGSDKLITSGYDGTNTFIAKDAAAYSTAARAAPTFVTGNPSTAPVEIGSTDSGFANLTMNIKHLLFWDRYVTVTERDLVRTWMLAN